MQAYNLLILFYSPCSELPTYDGDVWIQIKRYIIIKIPNPIAVFKAQTDTPAGVVFSGNSLSTFYPVKC